MPALVPTEATRAALVANQILTGIVNVATQAKKSLSEGVPAQGSLPAVTAADITSALGAANVTALQAIIAAAGV